MAGPGEKSGIKAVVASALRSFETWLLASSWRGKENDCVNLFAHRFLADHVAPDSLLRDLTQIGIEIGVPQPEGLGIKAAVRKDLVIWAAPAMTAWSTGWIAENYPLAIIEWKVRRKKTSAPILSLHDVQWLASYSSLRPDFTGFSVTVDFTSDCRRVASALVSDGQIAEDFHRQPR